MVWWLLVFQVYCVNILLLHHLQWWMTFELCFVYSLAWKQVLVCFQRWLMRSSHFAFNGWQMHWPVLGWGGRRGVCLHRLISQTKRLSRPSSCVGSDQTAGKSCRGSGKGPCPPGKTRWALSVTANITSLWTNELFTEMGHLKSSVLSQWERWNEVRNVM